jgi:hypothetical protein
MDLFQHIILWAAFPLSLSLILTTVVSLRAIIKAQDEENDSAAKQHLS